MEKIIGTQQYYYDFGKTSVWFEENFFGVRVVPKQEGAPKLTNPSENFLLLLERYQENADKIINKCGDDLGRLSKIDLSNLGLTLLPPHIVLNMHNAQELNLSGNLLHILPPQLQQLQLTRLDVSQNKGLQTNLPDWLGNLPNLKLVAHGLKLKYLPEGMSLFQLEADDFDYLSYESPKEQTNIIPYTEEV